MKRTRFAAAVLSLLLLSGCTQGAVTPEPSVRSGDIAYVPLDDRPDNVERVEYLANSLGYRLMMPEEDLYRTRLDDQPLNGNGTQYGDRAALCEWVVQQEADGCDRYILSMDQLLSGGLVNSRCFAGADVTLSDGTALSERELLAFLLETLAKDPQNQVWLLDSVMRLAPTVGYQGGDLDCYNAVRAFGAEPRPALTELSAETVEESYCLAADGTPLQLADFGLTEDGLADYLRSRQRKLELSAEMLSLLNDSDAVSQNFHVLVGIDDSSSEECIQKNEIACLRAALRQGDALLSGVDDLAFKAVTQLYLTEYGWYEGDGAVIRTTFFGGTEDQSACAYDYKPLTEIIREHRDFFHLTEAAGEEPADLELLVLTQPAEEGKQGEYSKALAARLRANEKAKIPTILIDAGNGRYGTSCHELLLKKCHLGQLLSYSGFLDMAIVTGTALSHGVARYAWLQNGNGGSEAAEYAFRQGLTESLLLDLSFKNTVRPKLLAYIRETLSGNPDNFCTPPLDIAALEQTLSEEMDVAGAAVLRNLAESNLLTDLNGSVRGWGSVEAEAWSFPWLRAFEVRTELTLAPTEKAHWYGF